MYKCWVLIYLTENINLHNVVWRSTCACEYECSHALAARQIYLWIISWMMAMMTIFIYMKMCTTKQVAQLDSTRCVGLNSSKNCWKLMRRIFCGVKRCWANSYLLQITSHTLWLIYWRVLNTVLLFFSLNNLYYYCGQPTQRMNDEHTHMLFACFYSLAFI